MHKWLQKIAKKHLSDLHFEISYKKYVPYSRLQLLKELGKDLEHINDMINYHILYTKLVKRKKSNIYNKPVKIPSNFLWWDTSTYESRNFIAKLILIDSDKRSNFLFRINDFRDSFNGLRLSISFCPKNKDDLIPHDEEEIDLFEFEKLFNTWIKNIQLYNNFKIDTLKNDEPFEADLFFSPDTKNEDTLNQLEIMKIERFLNELRVVVSSKRNKKKVKNIIQDIDYLKDHLTVFDKRKIWLYLNNIGRKSFWFFKEMTFELIKEIMTRSLLGS